MNSCCSLPIETIATNQHKNNDACCLVTEKTPAPTRADCPVSNISSKKVQKRTLEHLLKENKITSILNVQYYYCADPKCKVVYFSNESASYFTIDDVKVKVFTKNIDDDVKVCYCYDWTRSRIKEQIQQLGKSTAPLEIAKEVKNGNCACDVKNPKGECCLGDVNSFIKGIQSLISTTHNL